MGKEDVRWTGQGTAPGAEEGGVRAGRPFGPNPEAACGQGQTLEREQQGNRP